MTLREKLLKMEACSEAIEWVGDRDLATAWRECVEGAWMWWLLQKIGVVETSLLKGLGDVGLQLYADYDALERPLLRAFRESRREQAEAQPDADYEGIRRPLFHAYLDAIEPHWRRHQQILADHVRLLYPNAPEMP